MKETEAEFSKIPKNLKYRELSNKYPTMDEIEYKLNTNNAVLVVNAIEKLITNVKLKCQGLESQERERFLMENPELRFLREKCAAKSRVVSLTAGQGLLALAAAGVLKPAHTMSTIITMMSAAQLVFIYMYIVYVWWWVFV